MSDLTTLGAVLAGALVLHVAVFRALFRWGWRSGASRHTQQRLRWPARTLTLLLAALVAVPRVGSDPDLARTASHVLLIGSIATAGWLALLAIRVLEDLVLGRLDLATSDNLHARRRQTQVVILRRVGSLVVAVIVTSGILLTFDNARSLGASVLASAGVVGLVAGVAAQSTLANILAGVQIAFAEPIRLDDVVVVEGEWGNIEGITLTYVVVRTWDRRRLVLPSRYFLEHPFENWTREGSQVIGSISLFLDHHAPMDGLRGELQRLVEHSDRWDRDVVVLQMIDTTETTLHLRALVTAVDAQTCWDLRCEIREGLVRWLLAHHPDSLPTRRVQMHAPPPQTAADQGRLPPDTGVEQHADAFLGSAGLRSNGSTPS